MMKIKKSKNLKVKHDKVVKKRSKSKSKKDDDKSLNDKTGRIAKINAYLSQFDKKLYGLIVPESGNFIPDFLSMLKLMTLKL